MNDTLAFLKKRFSDYYTEAEMFLPDRFGKREWGFMFLGENFMKRHMAFFNRNCGFVLTAFFALRLVKPKPCLSSGAAY